MRWYNPALSVSLYLIFSLSLTAQINVESSSVSGNSAAYYVEELLLGEGIQAFNIQFYGDSLQIGEFGNGNNSNLGLNYGLMLATGDVAIADSFPNLGNASFYGMPLDSALPVNFDSALDAMSVQNTFHTAVLEFDFVPTGDTVRFNYVFASEEYNEYVCTQFNDVFGFFLSGPGITGVENLATVPGSNEIVAVNNINDGKANFNLQPQPCTYGGNNCACNAQYYVNNNYPTIGTTVQYDGFTVPLEAKHNVICGDTYHIRMAIADVGDGAFDSGVFLEGGSFSSNLIEVNITTVNGDSTINEGCGDAVFSFSRGDTTDTSVCYLIFGGTATNGVDFAALPDSIVLYPGVSESIIAVIPYADGLNEGVEDFTIQAINVTACGDTFISEGTLYIYDTAQLYLNTPDFSFDCPPDSFQVWVDVNGGGPPPFTYLWPNGSTSDSTFLKTKPNGGIDTFIVEVRDSCALKTYYDTVFVYKNYADDPIPSILNDTLVNCPGDELDLLAEVQFGAGDVTFLWSTGDTTNETTVIVSGSQTVFVTVTDTCGRVAVDTAFLGVKNAPPFAVKFPDTTAFCRGSLFTLDPKLVGGVKPYVYSWEGQFPVNYDDDSTFSFTLNKDTTVVFNVMDVCGRQFQKLFFVRALDVDPLKVGLPLESASCAGADFEFVPDLSGGLAPYSYAWSTGDTDSVITLTASVTQEIGLTVSDFCGNSVDTTSFIEVPEFGPLEIGIDKEISVCYGEASNVTAFARGGAGGYRYEWIPLSDPVFGESFVQKDSITFRVVSRNSNAHIFRVSDQCGNTLSDTLQVEVKHCVNVPNVVTPNGDGMNDAFYIDNINNYDDAHLFIYNRWGQKVFESKPYRNEWVPVDASSGTYYYVLRSANFPELRGTLTVINANDPY